MSSIECFETESDRCSSWNEEYQIEVEASDWVLELDESPTRFNSLEPYADEPLADEKWLANYKIEKEEKDQLENELKHEGTHKSQLRQTSMIVSFLSPNETENLPLWSVSSTMKTFWSVSNTNPNFVRLQWSFHFWIQTKLKISLFEVYRAQWRRFPGLPVLPLRQDEVDPFFPLSLCNRVFRVQKRNSVHTTVDSR